MASMRDIKRRRDSIESTEQITRAMKLVSTVKLQKARAQAEEQVRALLEQARADADRRAGEAGAESRAQCQRLKQEAEARLDQAAALIVERIGNR